MTMIQRFLLWLRSHYHHDDEPTTGAQAIIHAEKLLARAETQTAAAKQVATDARESRQNNHYAEALRGSLKGKYRP